MRKPFLSRCMTNSRLIHIHIFIGCSSTITTVASPSSRGASEVGILLHHLSGTVGDGRGGWRAGCAVLLPSDTLHEGFGARQRARSGGSGRFRHCTPRRGRSIHGGGRSREIQRKGRWDRGAIATGRCGRGSSCCAWTARVTIGGLKLESVT